MAKSKPIARRRETRVIKGSWAKGGRGKKEIFQGRKDTIFRKCHELTSIGDAHVIALIYQPHRKVYHVYHDQEAPTEIWPFDIDAFVRTPTPSSLFSVYYNTNVLQVGQQQTKVSLTRISDEVDGSDGEESGSTLSEVEIPSRKSRAARRSPTQNSVRVRPRATTNRASREDPDIVRQTRPPRLDMGSKPTFTPSNICPSPLIPQEFDSNATSKIRYNRYNAEASSVPTRPD